MMESRTRRRNPPKYFIPKLYLCCAVVASGGPHLAHGGDASGGSKSSSGSSSSSPHGRPLDDDDESDGSSTGQRHESDRRRHRWIPPQPHANEMYGYDSLVIDPISMFGSPHGGFSRDVSSRLAALPLSLPSLSQERPPEHPTHLTIRDGRGQLYACRVYHQDELDGASWDDGLFELPRVSELVIESSSTAADTITATTASSSGSTAASSAAVTRDDEEIKAKTGAGITLRDHRPDDELEYEDEADEGGGDVLRTSVDNVKPGDSPQDPSRKGVELAEVGLDGRVTAANNLKATATSGNVIKEEVAHGEAEDDELEEADDDEDGEKAAPATFTKDDVEERLGALEGACAHIHLGWWSTEWSVPLLVP
jgi:hypothetical protein